MNRYSVISEKNQREIVLLRGSGCKWLKCRFCNYHLDKCPDEDANFILNKTILNSITGMYEHLEVINSGRFAELYSRTMEYILKKCIVKNIHTLHFESHYMYKDRIASLKQKFSSYGITVKIKIGIETFDTLFRECYLVKVLNVIIPLKYLHILMKSACYREYPVRLKTA